MADLGSSFLQGVQSGEGLTKDLISGGVDAYENAKKYREMINERKQDREDRINAATAAASFRTSELDYRKKTEADAAAFRSSEVEERKARDAAEAAHWKAMEKIAAGRAPAGGRGPGAQMTRAQAAAAAHAIDTTFSKKDAPAMSKELFDQREDFRSLANPDYKKQTFQAPAPSFWERHNPFKSSAPTAETGSGLPGLE